MNKILVLVMVGLLTSVSTVDAQTPIGEATHPTEGHPKKKAEKNVKTNGKISTSGCETASGKTLAENDFGYEDCVKQIGVKKKHAEK